MTTLTPLSRDSANTATSAAAGVSASTSRSVLSTGASTSGTQGGDASTVVSLGADNRAPGQAKAFVWENRTRSTSSFLMARNFAEQPPAGRLTGLGAELLKQVAYDGDDFSQSIQQAPTGMQADT
jgi:hypothetical protein